MEKRRKWLCVFLAVTVFAVSCPAVYAGGTAEESGRVNRTEEEKSLLAPYFVIYNEDTSLDTFPLKATDVVTNMSGMIAETYVTQTYANEGNTPINGRYVFPTSSGVTVHGMKMTIGNQVVTAQIKEKEEAKEEYETAKSEGKSASLLEQKRPNVFTMDVANIMPGDTICIELHYTELITPAEGIYKFVFPTVVGPRYAGDSAAGGDSRADDAEGDESIGNEDTENTENENIGNGNTENENLGDGNTNNENTDNENAGKKNKNDENNIDNSIEDGKNEQQGTIEKEEDGQEEAAANGEENNENNSIEKNNESEDSWVASPYLPEGATPPGEYHITVNLAGGVPITDLSCKSHKINVEWNGQSEARITLADSTDYAGNRDFILKYRLAGEDVCSGLILTQGEEENYFMLTVQPPEHYEPEEIPPREYIFVLDVSGSMIGYPLDTAKALIRDLVTGLRETDKFNLVLFANETTVLAEESLSANGWNIKTAMEMIQKQQGGGGTSMAPALNKAIAMPLDEEAARCIVVITDGYVSNDSEIIDLVNQNMNTASFFSFGIGSSVNDYLIKGIAEAGLGEAFIVTNSEDAVESAQNFRAYIEAPLLTGITIDYGGFDVYDVEPSLPSILFAQRPIVLFGKWRGEPTGTIKVSGKSGDRDYVQKISIADVNAETEGEAIRYLWARTRLDQLAGYGSVRNDVSVKEEITRIGLEYNMTTPYTSFVAVVEEVRNPEGDSQDVDQALPLPLHVTNLAIGGGYTAYSEPGEIFLLIIMVLAPLCCMIRSKRKRGRTCAK